MSEEQSRKQSEEPQPDIQRSDRSVTRKQNPVFTRGHRKTSSKSDFFRQLREIVEEHPYISFARLKQVANRTQIKSIDTFKDYLGQAVKGGILHDAGKGWYSRLSEPAQLDPDTITELVQAVEASFPLLDFSVWSTTQLNPWLHHLLAQPVYFLNAPADALETVGDTLRDGGWEVAINPPDSAARKAVRPGQKMVVLRPTLSRQPKPDRRQARMEHILVDLLVENGRCGLMDNKEAMDTVERILEDNLLQVSGMQRYAESRKLEHLEKLERIINPLPSLGAAQ